MSVRAMSYIWDLELEDSTAKFILIAYADHADHDGGSIFPSVATIAKKTGYNERTVQRATRRLEDDGLLIPDGESDYGTRRWRLNMGWQGGDSVPGGGADDRKRDGESQNGASKPPEPSSYPSSQPSLLLEPETPAAEWLFGEIMQIVSAHNSTDPPRKKRAARRFQNIKQKELVEQAEQRLGLPEFQKAANYYFAKGLTSIGELSAKIGNWKGYNRDTKPNGKRPTEDIGLTELAPGVY